MGWFFGTIFTLLVALPAGMQAYQSFYYNRVCETEWIKSIGGCDRSGYCGVRYESGRFGEALRPAIGQAFAVCRLEPK